MKQLAAEIKEIKAIVESMQDRDLQMRVHKVSTLISETVPIDRADLDALLTLASMHPGLRPSDYALLKRAERLLG